MGWFSKDSDSKLDKSGSAGKSGKGYEKGKASTNPEKYKPRTDAQAKREDRKVSKFWK